MTLTLPRKTLLKETASVARRYKISVRAQTAFLAKLIKIGGGNVADFILSSSSSHRHSKQSVRSSAQKIIDEKKELMKDKELQLHFDGKSVRHFMEGKIAVIPSSPSLEEDILLGIPAVVSSSWTRSGGWDTPPSREV